jgi:hypothetical protein
MNHGLLNAKKKGIPDFLYPLLWLDEIEKNFCPYYNHFL